MFEVRCNGEEASGNVGAVLLQSLASLLRFSSFCAQMSLSLTLSPLSLGRRVCDLADVWLKL